VYSGCRNGLCLFIAVAARCPAAIVIDKQNKQCIAVVETDYACLLDEIEQDFLAIKNSSDERLLSENKIELESLTEAETAPYLQQVEKIKQYIVDGDIFQANLSRQWRAVLKQDVSDAVLFVTLSKHNPSSFAAMACLQDMTIISSSPERLVSLKNGIVETRPIAGTRPRDDNQQSDEALAQELLSHPKEQAEHIMLIDLERNDLGRVCTPGSIEVNELMVLESWQHVHHIVSNVRGELADKRSPVDVLRAVFPGGTITGCPKVRCMEILAEMEQQARGAYTGSLGYINNDGSMDFNILIRTMVRSREGSDEMENKRITFRAGGGIVSDSIAEKELEETRAKAKGLLKIFC
jgi:anthranilate synthase component 1